MIPSRVQEYLDNTGARHVILRHRRAYSAMDAAAALGILPGEVAKTIVLGSRGETVLATIPADSRLDLRRMGEILGDPDVALLPEESFRTLFPDCEIGTMPPLGRLHGMKIIVDSRLGAEESITFQAGSHEDAVRMSWREYARIESPTTRDITSARTSP
jgi:Ala-tRNA(Pro) deacylase